MGSQGPAGGNSSGKCGKPPFQRWVEDEQAQGNLRRGEAEFSGLVLERCALFPPQRAVWSREWCPEAGSCRSAACSLSTWADTPAWHKALKQRHAKTSSSRCKVGPVWHCSEQAASEWDGDRFVLEGTGVKLECEVEGQPAPEVTWLKDGSPLELPAAPHLRLYLESVQPADSGVYSCGRRHWGSLRIAVHCSWSPRPQRHLGEGWPAASQARDRGQERELPADRERAGGDFSSSLPPSLPPFLPP
uniref:Ig-like domain-containing protein n=1 Tax=Terrapene triunguis TaxID=2587831 RepID=A0A674JUX8_9SAUR